MPRLHPSGSIPGPAGERSTCRMRGRRVDFKVADSCAIATATCYTRQRHFTQRLYDRSRFHLYCYSHLDRQFSYTSTVPLVVMAPSATTLRSESAPNASVGAMGKTKSGKPLKVRSYPHFESLEEERLYRKQYVSPIKSQLKEIILGHRSAIDPQGRRLTFVS